MSGRATRRTVVRFGLVLVNILILAGLLVSLVFDTARLARDRHRLDRSRAVQVVNRQALAALLDAESSQRAFLLTSRPRFLAGYNRARGEIGQELADLGRLTVGDSTQQVRIGQLRQVVAAKFRFLDDLNRTLHYEGLVIADRDLDYGHRLLGQARELFDAMGRDEAVLYAALLRRFDATTRRMYTGLGVLLAEAVVFLALLAGVTWRAARLRRAIAPRAGRPVP